MKAELEKLVKAERKHKRELAELRQLKHRLSQQASPDAKSVRMVDEEIARLLSAVG